MKKSQIKKIVQDCISNTHNCQYEAKDIADTHHLKDDLGMDSLDFIEMVMALEKEFEISFSDEELQGKENISLNELVESIYQKVSAK